MNFGISKEFYYITYEDYDYFVLLLTSVGQGCFIAKADIQIQHFGLFLFILAIICCELRCSSDWMVQMSNIFTYFIVSLPFSSHDVSIVISNLIQTTTARWRHGSQQRQQELR